MARKKTTSKAKRKAARSGTVGTASKAARARSRKPARVSRKKAVTASKAARARSRKPARASRKKAVTASKPRERVYTDPIQALLARRRRALFLR